MDEISDLIARYDAHICSLKELLAEKNRTIAMLKSELSNRTSWEGLIDKWAEKTAAIMAAAEEGK